jgi:hypothetical protein
VLGLGLIKIWPLTLFAAGFGLLSTVVIVRLYGAEAFASYVVDLAKVASISIAAELVPSSHSIFRMQQDRAFMGCLPAAYVLMGAIVALLVILIVLLDGFSAYSVWIHLYALAVVFHRMMDTVLLSAGETRLIYLVSAQANIVKVGILVMAGWLLPDVPAVDIIWFSVAISLTVASLLTALRSRALRSMIGERATPKESFIAMWRERRRFIPYYPTLVLKRARDVAVPLWLDYWMFEKREVARYALAYRGVEVVCGHIRVVEALLSNYKFRHAVARTRLRSMLALSILGTPVGVVAVLVMLEAAGMAREGVIGLALIASLFVAPYVFEIGARSDALAEFKPRIVGRALAVMLVVTAAGLALVAHIGAGSATEVIFVVVAAQSSGAASYYWLPRSSRNQK